MTPISDVFTLSVDDILNEELVDKVKKKKIEQLFHLGFS